MVEGNKTIKEIPHSPYHIVELYSVNPQEINHIFKNTTQVSATELKKISFLQHPKDSVAVCKLPEEAAPTEVPIELILDGIQDPGNLGTIIRLADWFGIEQIRCSMDTVDVYNPKVIQASMGSFLRVKVVYEDIADNLGNTKNPVLGTDMEGENIYKYDFPQSFSLVLGNEGNGIRPDIESLLTQKITIPRFGRSQATESLNVSMATGIVLGEIFSAKA